MSSDGQPQQMGGGFVDSGGEVTVEGDKSNNTDPPGDNNIGTLPAVATVVSPVYNEGDQVALSTDLTGALRVNVAFVGGNPALAANGTPAPLFSIQGGGTDGVNIQPFHMFDLDTGAGSEYNQGFTWRFSAPGGSVEAGRLANPIRVDPTGTTTQPVSGTVTANQGTGAGAAAPWSTRLSDGAVFYVAAQTGQFPAALVGGRLDTNVGAWLGSTAPTVGQKTMAASVPIVISSDQSTVNVQGVKSNNTAAPGATNLGALPAVATNAAPTYTEGNLVALSTDLQGSARIAIVNNKVSYSSVISNLATAALATDIFTITGSATRTVRITRVAISGVKTMSSQELFLLLKRSTANSGGTSTTQAVVPHDSASAAGTAVVRAYTANPTTGTLVGALRNTYMLVPGNAALASQTPIIWTFGDRPNAQQLVLRGTSEVAAVNLNGVTLAGSMISMSFEWTEEA